MTFGNVLVGISLVDILVSRVFDMVVWELAIRRLYSTHVEIWIAIGKPVGPFWTPPGTTVTDTLTIQERRVGVKELLRRTDVAANAPEAVYMIQAYDQLRKLASAMLAMGFLLLAIGVAISLWK